MRSFAVVLAFLVVMLASIYAQVVYIADGAAPETETVPGVDPDAAERVRRHIGFGYGRPGFGGGYGGYGGGFGGGYGVYGGGFGGFGGYGGYGHGHGHHHHHHHGGFF